MSSESGAMLASVIVTCQTLVWALELAASRRFVRLAAWALAEVSNVTMTSPAAILSRLKARETETRGRSFTGAMLGPIAESHKDERP